jgi:hypothetical protein
MSQFGLDPAPSALPTPLRDVIITAGVINLVAAILVIAGIGIYKFRTPIEESVVEIARDVELAVRNPDRARAELPRARQHGGAA